MKNFKIKYTISNGEDVFYSLDFNIVDIEENDREWVFDQFEKAYNKESYDSEYESIFQDWEIVSRIVIK